MEKDRKFRALAIAAICVAVVGVSVAYAAFSTTLAITGTATVDTTSSWNVRWEDKETNDVAPVIQKDSSITVTEGPTVSGTNISWAAKFTAPNTTLTLTAYIKNDGNLNAMLQSGTYLTTDGSAKEKFDYTVTINGADASSKATAILASKQRVPVVVTVKLKDMDNEEFLNGDLDGKTATFMLSLPFIQAADGITTPTM